MTFLEFYGRPLAAKKLRNWKRFSTIAMVEGKRIATARQTHFSQSA